MKKLSRRDFLRTTILAGGAAVLASCAPAATVAPTTAPAATAVTAATAVPAATAAPALPFTIAPGAANPFKLATTNVDGVFFAGGYGDDYIKYCASMMEQAYPGMKVGVQSAQDITTILQPRFVGGNPPDVIDNSGAHALAMASLVADGQVADLADLMSAPALDTPGKTFKDSLIPGSQDSLVFDGKQLGINFVFSGYGVCYSQKLFDANKWTYPATWEDMITFCDGLVKEGKIAPWTHQAKYPYYVANMVLFPLIYSIGGNDMLVKLDNLEPNAWMDPSVLAATENYYMLYDHKWLLAGTAGLDHTGSQTEFYKGNCVFIPCGGWLENEMKTILPADFNTTMAILPPLKSGKGDPKAAQTSGGEPYIVPSKAKNVQHGKEFLRFLLSKAEAKYFAENVLSISAVVGGLDNAKASTFMKAQVQMANTANGSVIQQNMQTWYPDLWKELENQTTNLLTGQIKPADFVAAMQKAADKTAADSTVKKYKRTK